MGDKISVLSALCISQVDPLWNNIFFINWAKGNICSLGYWSFDGKMLGAHCIPSGSIQEKVTSDPQEAGGGGRDMKMKGACYSVLGLVCRAGHTPWLSQLRVLVKMLISEERPHLTAGCPSAQHRFLA